MATFNPQGITCDDCGIPVEGCPECEGTYCPNCGTCGCRDGSPDVGVVIECRPGELGKYYNL